VREKANVVGRWHDNRHTLVYSPTPYGKQRSGTGVTRSMQKRPDGATVTKWGESGSDLVTDEREYMVVEHMRQSRAEGMSLRAIAHMLNVAAVGHASAAARSGTPRRCAGF